MTEDGKPELFHAIGDAASAQARKHASDWGLLPQLRFRNIVYPEVQADFSARGGKVLPALWDGKTLLEGLDAVLERLKQMRG